MLITIRPLLPSSIVLPPTGMLKTASFLNPRLLPPHPTFLQNQLYYLNLRKREERQKKGTPVTLVYLESWSVFSMHNTHVQMYLNKREQNTGILTGLAEKHLAEKQSSFRSFFKFPIS